MSSPINYNDGFQQTNFINSLNYLAAAYVAPATTTPALGNQMAGAVAADFVGPNGTGLDLNNAQRVADANFAFANFLDTIATPLPQTAAAFFYAWQTGGDARGVLNAVGYPGQDLTAFYGGTPSNPVHNPPNPPEPLYQAGIDGLMEQLGISPAGASDPASDWNILTTPTVPAPNPPITYPPVPDMSAQFMAAFTKFLQTYTYAPGNKTIPAGSFSANYFFQQWFKFTATTATLQIPAPPLLTDTNSATIGAVPSYEEIYYTYHPGATKADFQTAIVKFYNQQISTNGFFLPSQSLSAWVLQNTTQYTTTISVPAPFIQVQADKSAIINRLIALLIRMITILQKVGIAQANTLKLVTSFQNVYVNLQAQIPVFSRGDKGPGPYAGTTSPLGRGTVNKTAADNERQQLNTVLNAQITQKIQSFRGVQEDYAKQVQSRVNQTNDAVTQQTDMATAFIQQLSSLVGTIFR